MKCKRCGRLLLDTREVVNALRNTGERVRQSAIRFRASEMATVLGPLDNEIGNTTANLLGFCGQGCEGMWSGAGELEVENAGV